MKQVQVNFEVSPEALERARKAFAKVTLTKEQTQQIEQASEAVAHVAVLAGWREYSIR